MKYWVAGETYGRARSKPKKRQYAKSQLVIIRMRWRMRRRKTPKSLHETTNRGGSARLIVAHGMSS